jgi:hypothetical protein
MKWVFLMPVIVTGLLESLVPHNHVLKTSLDVSEIIELKDYGRHIQIRDACQKDDTTYLVGGATTTQSSALGMDAFLFVYEGNELRHVESFGGMREDVFTTIHCESRLVLAGYSSSADFLAVPVNHFHRAFVLELSESFGVERLTVVDDPFQSTIHGLDVRGNHIVAVGHVQRITQSNFLYLSITPTTVTERVFGGDGFDVFYDVRIEDSVVAVGESSSREYGVSGPRAIQIRLHSNGDVLSTQPLLTSSASRYLYLDATRLAGESGGTGFVQARQSSQIQFIQESTSIHGRFGETWFGHAGNKGFIEGRPSLNHPVVAAFEDFIVLQKEGMLYEAMVMIPHRFHIENQILFYNDKPLEVRVESYWEELVYVEQEVAYAGPFKLIQSHKTIRITPTCNVKATIYYHPVQLVCNQPFELNGIRHQEPLLLHQPGTYSLVLDEVSTVFVIEATKQLVIDVVPEVTQVIAVVESESRMWMIPAAMFALFVGKKYLS